MGARGAGASGLAEVEDDHLPETVECQAIGQEAAVGEDRFSD